MAATSWDRFTPPPAPNCGDRGGECRGDDSGDLEVGRGPVAAGPSADSEPISLEDEVESRNLWVI